MRFLFRSSYPWVLRPEAEVILAAHLDTVDYVQEADDWSFSQGILRGKNGAIFADDKARVALVLYLHSLLP